MNKSHSIRLLMAGLPIINSLQELSSLTHLSKGLLYNLWKCNSYHYKVFEIDKKNGGKRTISSPSRIMKAIQAWILSNILEGVSVASSATAYIKGNSLLDNIKPHEDNRYFLCLDIEDFFPSITIKQVYTDISHMASSAPFLLEESYQVQYKTSTKFTTRYYSGFFADSRQNNLANPPKSSLFPYSGRSLLTSTYK